MTVKELIRELGRYPDNMEIYINYNSFLNPPALDLVDVKDIDGEPSLADITTLSGTVNNIREALQIS